MTDHILMENGSRILLENGIDTLILEEQLYGLSNIIAGLIYTTSNIDQSPLFTSTSGTQIGPIYVVDP